MLTLTATIASVVLNGLPADQPDAGDPQPRHETVFVAPMGIQIPVDHNGLVFFADAPGVAIDLFEPDAEVTLSEFTDLSQRHNLLELEIGRDGGVRSITLELPGFPLIEGEAPVRYLLLKPDGSAEFAVATPGAPHTGLVLTAGKTTRVVTARVAQNAHANAGLEVARTPDGSLKLVVGGPASEPRPD